MSIKEVPLSFSHYFFANSANIKGKCTYIEWLTAVFKNMPDKEVYM